MTKETIREQLALAMNLAALTKQVCEKIENELAETADDVLFDVTNGIQSYELTDVDEAMKILDDAWCFVVCDENKDEKLVVPKLELDEALNLTVKVPVNGGNLVIANTEYSNDTKQICLLYEKDGYLIDLAFAEVKAGELAEPDNKDIDLYVYTDPETEEYTKHYRIPYDKILIE